jgi:hypothetical protein
MGKTMCKSHHFQDTEKVNYACKKCGAKAKKEKQLCKPKKI